MNVRKDLAGLPWGEYMLVPLTLDEYTKFQTWRNGGPVLLSTTQAAELLGRKVKWWRRRAEEGKIRGAYRDPPEDGRWILPNDSCRELLEEMERKYSPTPRRFYGPRRKRPRVQPTGAPPS